MKKLLSIFITLFIGISSYAQCDKVNSNGLELSISPVEHAKMHNQLNIELKNNTEKELSFCWFDLEKTWGIPLCFKISVWEDSGDIILEDFSWNQHFPATILEKMPKQENLIKIAAGESESRQIVLYWENMTPGTYSVLLTYENGENKLISNTTSIRIK